MANAVVSAPETLGSTSRPKLPLLPILALFVLAWLWRLPTSPEEWRFLWCDNDSLFQLHRIQQSLERYPLVPSVDGYSHYPTGSRIHWLAPHTAFYATISRLAGVEHGDLEALGRFVSWIPPFLGVVAVALTLRIASSFTSDPRCVLAIGLLAALGAESCRAFFFGVIDHHLFGHLAMLLLVLGRLRRSLATWTFGLALFFSLTPEATFYVTVVLTVLWLSELGSDPASDRTRTLSRWLWFLAPSVVCLAAWIAQRQLETDPLPALDFSWKYLTLLQPLLFLLLGAGYAGTVAAQGSVRRAPALWSGVVALGCLIVFLVASGTLSAGWLRLMRIDRIFVGEEVSPLAVGFWGSSRWLRILFLAGVFWVVRSVLAFREGGDSDEKFRSLVMMMAFAIGLLEMRHMYILASLQMVGVGLAALATAQALGRLSMFSRHFGGLLPIAAISTVVGAVFITEHVVGRQATHGEACSFLPLAEELSNWLHIHGEGPREGSGTAQYGVFGPWWIGHHLHVLGGRPVVVDPLNYPEAEDSERAEAESWEAQSAEDLQKALRGHQVKYFVMTEPARAIVRTLRTADPARRELVRSTSEGKTVLLRGLSRFAAFRLFMSRGTASEFESFQPRFFSSETDRYGTLRQDGRPDEEILIPRGQIYELSPIPLYR